HSNLVFAAGFHPGYSAEQILAEAREWGRLHAEPLRARRRAHSNDASPSRRLRLGYVSPDFRGHCQRFFVLPVLRCHDAVALEVVCYSSVLQADRWTEAMRDCAHEWHDVRLLDDDALAEKIRSDRIDVLVDLTMHMASGRLKTF